MEKHTIKASFVWTLDKLLLAQKYRSAQICRPVFRFMLVALLSVSAIAGGLMIYSGGFDVAPAAMVFVFIYVVVIRPVIIRWKIGRSFKQRPDKDLELHWLFSEDGLESKNDLGESEISWKYIMKVVKTPEGILIYPIPRLFHWIPLSGFASPADMDEVVSMAEKNGVKVSKM